MSESKVEMSRRKFLGIGSVAALAGTAALGGCSSPKSASSSNGKGQEISSVAVKSTPDDTKSCDIVIVGAGGAGMWAAVEAVDAGKDVIVVEKGGNVGVSNGSIAGGPFMVGSKLQNNAGIDFGIEEAFVHIMEYAHWSTNAPAVRAAVMLSGNTIDRFTDDFGVPTGMRPDNYGAGHASVRANFQSDPKDSSTQKKGIDRMGPLQTYIEGKGGLFLFDTTGKALLTDGGDVSGVQCVTEGNKTLNIEAKKVIVCTGGFLGSTDKMMEHFGTFVNPLGSILSIGEGIDMVKAAGGQLSTQWGIAGNEFSAANHNAEGIWNKTNAAFSIAIYGPLLVNNQGRRFSNEGKYANLPLALGGAESLLGGQYYAIVDQKYIDGLNAGVDPWTLCGSDAVNWRTGSMTLKGKGLKDVQSNLDKAVDAGWCFKAKSIDELAKTINAPGLAETVKTYNAWCANGRDDEFYKPACFLQPVTSGPFYALQYEPSAWVTIGGVRTNDKLNAIDDMGMPIKNLYVAGADNGTLMMAPYMDYEGYSLMCAYNGGRLAGKYAVASISQ